MARRADSDTPAAAPLADKLARLVLEKGWTQQQFAAAAGLNRLTVRRILERRPSWLRGDTVKACATALGFTVDEVTHTPLPTLLARLQTPANTSNDEYLQQRQPQLAEWLAANPKHDLTADEIAEVASIQGVGGQLSEEGVRHFIDRVRRKRVLLRHVEILAGTPYLEMLEELTSLMLAKLTPPAESARSSRGAAKDWPAAPPGRREK